MPFTTLDGSDRPIPVLAQISPSRFEVRVPFRYRHPTLLTEGIVVPDEAEPGDTDLASVPRILLWFVPRYGVHTLAALVHDQLVSKPPEGGRPVADTIFRDALGELQVPWIRRWIMWAAVSLATFWSRGTIDKVRVLLWMGAVVATGAAVWEKVFSDLLGFDGWSWWVFGFDWPWLIVGLVIAAMLLTPHVGLGWLAGGAVWFVLVPSLVVAIWVAGYVVAEWILRGGLWLVGRTKREVVNNPVVMSLSEEQSDPDSGA